MKDAWTWVYGIISKTMADAGEKAKHQAAQEAKLAKEGTATTSSVATDLDSTKISAMEKAIFDMRQSYEERVQLLEAEKLRMVEENEKAFVYIRELLNAAQGQAQAGSSRTLVDSQLQQKLEAEQQSNALLKSQVSALESTIATLESQIRNSQETSTGKVTANSVSFVDDKSVEEVKTQVAALKDTVDSLTREMANATANQPSTEIAMLRDEVRALSNQIRDNALESKLKQNLAEERSAMMNAMDGMTSRLESKLDQSANSNQIDANGLVNKLIDFQFRQTEALNARMDAMTSPASQRRTSRTTQCKSILLVMALVILALATISLAVDPNLVAMLLEGALEAEKSESSLSRNKRLWFRQGYQ